MTIIPFAFEIKWSEKHAFPSLKPPVTESLCRFSSSPPLSYIYQPAQIDPKPNLGKENQSDWIGIIIFFFTVLPPPTTATRLLPA